MLEHRGDSIDQCRVYMRQRDVQLGTALHGQLEYVRGSEYSGRFDGWSVSFFTAGDAGFEHSKYGRSYGVTQKVRSRLVEAKKYSIAAERAGETPKIVV